MLRSGLTVKIVDKAAESLDVGRADAVQPRVLEIMKQLGLLNELLATGPLIDHTILYKDGKCLVFRPSHASPSEFQYLQVITQPEVERLLIRDIARFGCYVDRSTTLDRYVLEGEKDHTGKSTISLDWTNIETGASGSCRARYLIGSDGAHSAIRKSLSIPFDGVTTNLVWQIVDAEWDTNFPHAWVFGCVLSSEHGGVLIIPRENNMSRLYVRVLPGADGKAPDPNVENVDTAMKRINDVFAPYYVKPKGPIEWYTMWKINERVARSFHDDQDGRVFLAGDSAHCHSAAGAYGLNTGCMDSHNLSWKLILDAKGISKPAIIDSYSVERRATAKRIVQASSCFLRFLCGARGADTFAKDFAIAAGEDPASIEAPQFIPQEGDQSMDPDQAFFSWYARTYTGLLTGTDILYKPSTLNKPWQSSGMVSKYQALDVKRADVNLSRKIQKMKFDEMQGFASGESDAARTERAEQAIASPQASPMIGYRTPNPRLFNPRTGAVQRLYDSFAPLPCFNIVLLGGDMSGSLGPLVCDALDAFAKQGSFRTRFANAQAGQARLMKMHLILDAHNVRDRALLDALALRFKQALSHNATGTHQETSSKDDDDPLHHYLEIHLDDQPDEGRASSLFGTAAEKMSDAPRERAFIVRPDLWLGTKSTLEEFQHSAESYFADLLHPHT
ncbi:hypothetical protein IE81DRAFT_257064 [Ceraceosorus guamensis]|uniref:FAD-binding domain-containing protein n=1 Tax=Ceraceosorus guamensis TaxID=1522189 RepID=A0A316VQD9_9BASI|nr:hypothetical protein IE81DRAFT_257064 [Ceraceosorus guamensis]PWN39817.1 hypothetical protein IE81DRAFT_257064 [Ceraceosorus guamensis]